MKTKDFLLVILQFLLFIVFTVLPAGFGPPFIFPFITFILTVGGLLIVATGMYQLGSNITPFPTPLKNASLTTEGIYKFIRHPIYTGILLCTFGISLYTASYPRLVISVLLYVLFEYKSRYEEQMLCEKFPGYVDYKLKAGRFFPRLTNLKNIH
jgi:protein-S-isoprenylcysteine O-methyltransferase Ste14